MAVKLHYLLFRLAYCGQDFIALLCLPSAIRKKFALLISELESLPIARPEITNHLERIVWFCSLHLLSTVSMVHGYNA